MRKEIIIAISVLLFPFHGSANSSDINYRILPILNSNGVTVDTGQFDKSIIKIDNNQNFNFIQQNVDFDKSNTHDGNGSVHIKSNNSGRVVNKIYDLSGLSLKKGLYQIRLITKGSKITSPPALRLEVYTNKSKIENRYAIMTEGIVAYNDFDWSVYYVRVPHFLPCNDGSFLENIKISVVTSDSSDIWIDSAELFDINAKKETISSFNEMFCVHD